MKNVLNWLAILSVVVLSACGGGGGGGSTPTPAPITAVANTTAENLIVGTAMASFSPLVATGGTLPYTYSYTGTLPAGLSYDATTGAMTGTPTVTYTTASLIFSVQDASVPPVVASMTSTVSFTVTNAPTYSISGSVTGGVQAGVTITVTPGNVTTTTAADGSFTLSGFVNNTYTVTPTYSSNPTFSPSATLQAVVNGANVTGVNFTTSVPMQTTGKLIFPAYLAADVKDLATGNESVLWGSSSALPEKFSVSRTGGILAFNGSNINCLNVMSFVALSPSCVASVGAQEDFDITESGDVAVVSHLFTTIGSNTTQQNIMLYLLDGSGVYFRVTNGPDADVHPAVCSHGNATIGGTVCFVRGTDILSVVVNPANNTAGAPVIIASNVMSGYARAMAFSPDYSQMVFMKNVGGVSHIVVKPNAAGGTEVDLGPGTDPYWALDGSNRIKFTANHLSWTRLPDGTGLLQLPTPTNIYGMGLNWLDIALSNEILVPSGY